MIEAAFGGRFGVVLGSFRGRSEVFKVIVSTLNNKSKTAVALTATVTLPVT